MNLEMELWRANHKAVYFRCQSKQQFLVFKIWLLTIAVWLPNEILVDLVLLGTAGTST
jgi:hypothetical protein